MTALISRVSVRKTFAHILQKQGEIWACFALHFCAKKLRSIIRKLCFAQKCATLLLRYSVLRNIFLFKGWLNGLTYTLVIYKIALYGILMQSLKRKMINYSTLHSDAWWHTANQYVLTLTQKSSSIMPTTPFKVKLETYTLHF